MPTLIDSLVISVGLDSSKFSKGSRDVQDAYRKTKDEAVKSSKQIEESTLKIEKSINKVTAGVLGLFSILLAGRGFKEFIKDVNDANLTLGRFSGQLGLSPKWVGEFEQIVKRVGGTAEEAKDALNSANQAIQDFALGKGVPEAISRMQARVGGKVDFSNPAAYLTSLAPILAKYAEINAAQERYFAQQLGLSEAVNEALIRNGTNLQANMDKLADNQPTNKAIQAAKDLNQAWVDLQAKVASVGSKVSEVVDGPMTQLLNQITNKLGEKTTIDFLDDQVTKTIKDMKELVQTLQTIYSFVLPSKEDVIKDMQKGQGAGPLFPLTPAPSGIRPGSRGRFGASSTANPADLPAPGAGERSAEFDTSGFMIPGQSSALPLKVGSSEVSTGNPLPVAIVSRGAAGGSLWDWLTGGAGSGGSSGFSGGATTGSGGVVGAIKRFLGGGGSSSGGIDNFGSGSSHILKGEGLQRASHLINHLMEKYGWTREQAIGAAGVMGYESGNFTTMQEIGQAPGHGGWGYAQWTGSRRRDFMNWFKSSGLKDPSSMEANEGFLDWEMQNSSFGRRTRAGMGNHKSIADAANFFEHAFEGMTEGGPGIPAFAGHIARAQAYGRNPALNGAAGALTAASRPTFPGHLPGHGAGASLSTTGIQHIASTDASVRSMHIGAIHVNAPNATDAEGIAQNIQPVLSRNWQAQFANQGPM